MNFKHVDSLRLIVHVFAQKANIRLKITVKVLGQLQSLDFD